MARPFPVEDLGVILRGQGLFADQRAADLRLARRKPFA